MNTLLTCLQNECSVMADLVHILQQEQTALTQAPTVELMNEVDALTRTKNQLIAAISESNQVRNKELLRLGFNPEQTTLSKWLHDKTQRACWEQLVAQTSQAEELNRVNGLLITKHLARGQSALDILYKKHQTGTDPALYGANGQSTAKGKQGRGVEV